MAKVIDTIELRKALLTLGPASEKLYQEVAPEMVRRVKAIRDLQGKTTDENQLRRLSSSETFMCQVVSLIDSQREAILFAARHFESIDNTYWKAILDHEGLTAERDFWKERARVYYLAKLDRDEKLIDRVKSLGQRRRLAISA